MHQRCPLAKTQELGSGPSILVLVLEVPFPDIIITLLIIPMFLLISVNPLCVTCHYDTGLSVIPAPDALAIDKKMDDGNGLPAGTGDNAAGG